MIFFHLKAHTFRTIQVILGIRKKEEISQKQKQYEAANYSIVSLCITLIKSRRLTSCLLLTEN